MAENISFAYPSAGNILTDVSFSVDSGDVVCLLGPNGAGKTTLLRCLLGIVKIRTGSIFIRGQKIQAIPAKELAAELAYVPQATATVFPYRVLDIVVMGRTPHIDVTAVPAAQDYAIAQESLAELGILHLADALFSRISGGERQLTLLARALTQRARLLIMDEPTASLDYGNQVRILRMIDKLAKQGYSIIMTSHFPNHAFLLCNQVMIMKQGQIVAQGSPEAVVTETVLSDLYMTKVKVVEIDAGESKTLKVCLPLLG
ncbi:ABC transporter ATP-binding protein [Sporomusa sp.]|uniref:ABC transporter ATP-binding protein n=1 Tax=Sporomusa sp. TaxID=2078658 RepID=UPI002C2A4EDF|nr:ABC transporter ATP-binding protein [Sporomusa sp.]HWR06581.1 ABC transporter ATP-binding protein [Sporomusa sp.]